MLRSEMCREYDGPCHEPPPHKCGWKRRPGARAYPPPPDRPGARAYPPPPETVVQHSCTAAGGQPCAAGESGEGEGGRAEGEGGDCAPALPDYETRMRQRLAIERTWFRMQMELFAPVNHSVPPLPMADEMHLVKYRVQRYGRRVTPEAKRYKKEPNPSPLGVVQYRPETVRHDPWSVACPRCSCNMGPCRCAPDEPVRPPPAPLPSNRWWCRNPQPSRTPRRSIVQQLQAASTSLWLDQYQPSMALPFCLTQCRCNTLVDAVPEELSYSPPAPQEPVQLQVVVDSPPCSPCIGQRDGAKLSPTPRSPRSAREQVYRVDTVLATPTPTAGFESGLRNSHGTQGMHSTGPGRHEPDCQFLASHHEMHQDAENEGRPRWLLRTMFRVEKAYHSLVRRVNNLKGSEGTGRSKAAVQEEDDEEEEEMQPNADTQTLPLQSGSSAFTYDTDSDMAYTRTMSASAESVSIKTTRMSFPFEPVSITANRVSIPIKSVSATVEHIPSPSESVSTVRTSSPLECVSAPLERMSSPFESVSALPGRESSPFERQPSPFECESAEVERTMTAFQSLSSKNLCVNLQRQAYRLNLGSGFEPDPFEREESEVTKAEGQSPSPAATLRSAPSGDTLTQQAGGRGRSSESLVTVRHSDLTIGLRRDGRSCWPPSLIEGSMERTQSDISLYATTRLQDRVDLEFKSDLNKLHRKLGGDSNAPQWKPKPELRRVEECGPVEVQPGDAANSEAASGSSGGTRPAGGGPVLARSRPGQHRLGAVLRSRLRARRPQRH